MRLELLIVGALFSVVRARPIVTSRILECTDDDTFFLNDNEKRNCAWAGRKNLRKRCSRKDEESNKKVLFFCPLTCKKKCEFFKANQYCYLDDLDFVFKGNAKKTCAWVAKNPNKRCNLKNKKNKKIILENCPSACDLRCSCEDSATFQYENKYCTQIKKRVCKKDAGDGKLVSDLCPNSCNTCFIIPPPETQTPTGSPTFSAYPSGVPSGTSAEILSSTFKVNVAFESGTEVDAIKEIFREQIEASFPSAISVRARQLSAVNLDVDVSARDCDFGVDISESECYVVTSTLTASSDSGASPSDITLDIENDIASGDFEEEIRSRGFTGAVLALPLTEQPSPTPSTHPSFTAEPSTSPSFVVTARTAGPSSTASPTTSPNLTAGPTTSPNLTAGPTTSPNLTAAPSPTESPTESRYPSGYPSRA